MKRSALPRPEMLSPGHRNDSRTSFWQRLSVFLLGIGIGFALLGLLTMGKQRAVQAQRDAAAAAQSAQPAQATPASTPTP